MPKALKYNKVQKPSVKNVILIASAAIIIGAAFAVSKYENTNYYASASTTNSNGASLQLPVIIALATSTTDDNNATSSGNWQKTLSTSFSGSWEDSSSSGTAASSTPLTPTQALGENLFSLYSQASNQGEDMTDPSVQQAIVDKVLSDGTEYQVRSPRYMGRHFWAPLACQAAQSHVLGQVARVGADAGPASGQSRHRRAAPVVGTVPGAAWHARQFPLPVPAQG